MRRFVSFRFDLYHELQCKKGGQSCKMKIGAEQSGATVAGTGISDVGTAHWCWLSGLEMARRDN